MRHLPAAASFRTETTGSPTFLGNPNDAFALLSDPGGSGTPGPYQCADAAPTQALTVKAPAKRASFEAQSHGFSTRCLRLAAPVTRSPPKTRFRPLAKLYRVGLATHRVPSKGF